jgi:hypothetical protein
MVYILHCSTYHGFLLEDYESRIKTQEDVDAMLAEKEIDESQYKVLKGFVKHFNFVFAEPSEEDKQAVAKAYCDYYKGKCKH